MVQRSFFILTIIALAIGSATASADALRGYMERHANQRFLRIETTAPNGTTAHNLFAIEPLSEDLKSDLFRLKPGDFVVARGAITPDGKTVQIEAIESLGITALVGKWMTERFEVYDFRDFSEMTLYVPTYDPNVPATPGIVKAGDFHYAVTPDQGSGYAIFLSGNQTVMVGSIQFHKGRVKMNVIDPKTGLITSSVLLSPLPFAASPLLK